MRKRRATEPIATADITDDDNTTDLTVGPATTTGSAKKSRVQTGAGR